MNSRKPVNIISIFGESPLQSLTEIQPISIVCRDLDITSFPEIEQKEYKAFGFEQQKKFSKAAKAWLATLPLKKAALRSPKLISEQANKFCEIVITWFLHCMNKGKSMKAYLLLGILQELTEKSSKIKFKNKKRIRVRVFLYTGYYYIKQKKPSAALEFLLRGLDLSRNLDVYEEPVLISSLSGYAACLTGHHQKALELNIEALEVLSKYSDHLQLANPQDVEIYNSYQAISLYNLSVEALHTYLRADAMEFISKAVYIVDHYTVSSALIRNKIIWLYQELFGSPYVESIPEPSRNLSRFQGTDLNFMPGVKEEEEQGNKIVKVRCESPKSSRRTPSNSKKK
ncbi:unnamed protein product [Blepharisma stoltei]|uniref:Tetratricopeptide repeat protein n=1 Tax=Blepharisma stoltei TaxID=1481888 RepID=A0AAU9IFV4_9CILI|nr:unnamed protein product [Blepharisma stoltei]